MEPACIRSHRPPCPARSAILFTATLLLALGGCPVEPELDRLGLGTTPSTDTESSPEVSPQVAGGSSENDDTCAGLRFAVEPTDGPRDLTVSAYAFTVSGDPLPEGTYEWSFDDDTEAGPMETHAQTQHTFRTGGLHIVRLSLTLAGVTVPIGCAQGPDRTTDHTTVTVWPTLSGRVYDAQGNPLAGVQVVIDGTDLLTTTDTTGRYAISTPRESSGTLRATLTDYTFSPAAWSFSNLTNDLDNVDFSAAPAFLPIENSPPEATGQSVETNEDTSVTITLLGSDPDDDWLTYVIALLPEHGTLRDESNGHLIQASELPYTLCSGGNRVTYLPADDYNGSDDLAFLVSDGIQDSGPAPAVVALSVAAANDPPHFMVPTNRIMGPNAPLVVQISALSPGPPDEADQTVTLSAHSSNQAVIPDANLVFSEDLLSITATVGGEPVTITVTAQDDGGTENAGQDSSADSFVVTVVTGPVVFGAVSRVETVGANPPIGPIGLRLTGSGAYAETDFDVVSDAQGVYCAPVPAGWTGTVAAADPNACHLTPAQRECADPMTEPQGHDFVAWCPPIGIPAPPFGIRETHYMYAEATYDFGNGPEPYHDAGNGPYTHYVDNTHANATDASNPFGTHLVPRQTIPQNLTPASVVEVHGGPYAWGPGFIPINGQGTAEAPIFIRGVAAPRFGIKLAVWHNASSESCYIIFEDLDLYKWQLVAPSHHIVLRNCNVSGDNAGGGAHVSSFSAPHVCHNAVIYNNTIHDNGDWQADYDQDIHGVAISARCHDVWVIDNALYHNSGDGLQINAGSLEQMPTTHHIYAGRNRAYENKQAGLWTKQAVDVIFSQNLVHSHEPIGEQPSAWGPGMGFQYGPEQVWFLYNHIHDCSYGIQTTSPSGLGDGQDAYYIGNVIHDIHHHPAYAYYPETAWSNAAIMLVGVPNRHIINNTIYNVDAGVNGPSNGAYYIVNNIIANVTEPDGQHIFIEHGSAAENSLVANNVLTADVRIKWGSGTVYSLAMFEAAFPSNASGSIDADPHFVDPGSSDFHLDSESPAIDLGLTHEVYATFLERYGISIAVDHDGAVRPNGEHLDAGAYEAGGP